MVLKVFSIANFVLNIFPSVPYWPFYHIIQCYDNQTGHQLDKASGQWFTGRTSEAAGLIAVFLF